MILKPSGRARDYLQTLKTAILSKNILLTNIPDLRPAKTKARYTSTTTRGGQWTITVVVLCLCLTFSELATWYAGSETHHFSVERGVGHELQLNLDIVIAMPCKDLHVNVQDAAMDRIMAGDLLTKEETNFELWLDPRKIFRLRKMQSGMYSGLHEGNKKRQRAEEEDSHVGHVLGHMREGGKKFQKAPKLPKSTEINSCRIYGSLEGNKVQGDFHITARGHGYMEFGMPQHLDHQTFNFSHHINELSFGPHYPSLLNPLDKTSDTTSVHFMRYQYYLSIVPTIFTKRRVSTKSGSLDPAALPQPPTLDLSPHTIRDKDGIIHHVPHPDSGRDSKSIFTNQYAAQSQSREVPTSTVPGIFFKYDIEPILLIVSESRTGFLGLVVRLVNVISGVIVGGGWMFQLSEWAGEVYFRRKMRRSATGLGVLDLGGKRDGNGEAKH